MMHIFLQRISKITTIKQKRNKTVCMFNDTVRLCIRCIILCNAFCWSDYPSVNLPRWMQLAEMPCGEMCHIWLPYISYVCIYNTISRMNCHSRHLRGAVYICIICIYIYIHKSTVVEKSKLKAFMRPWFHGCIIYIYIYIHTYINLLLLKGSNSKHLCDHGFMDVWKQQSSGSV